jgi:putative NADH-flavin reductase
MSNVLVLGASGGVGQHLVRLAAARGHAVTAVSRTPIATPPGVAVVLGDVKADDVIDRAMPNQHAVLSALGVRRVRPANPWSALASPPDFAAATARRIVAAMTRHGVRRVIAVSAAGVGDSAPGLNLLMRFFVAWSNVGVGYRDLAVMEQVYAASALDWCCVRPTALKDGPVTKRVRQSATFPMTAWISRADVADWMVDHLDADLSRERTPMITETGV